MFTMTLQQALELAIQHHRAGRIGEAEAIYRNILAHSPEQPDALYRLGLIAIQVGRNDLAVDLIGKVVNRFPGVAEVHQHYGLALAGTRAFEQAIAQFHLAIRLQPDLAEAHFGLGNAYLELGQLEPADAAYRQAVALKPDYAWAYANMGNIALRHRKLDAAVAAFEAALRIEPNNVCFLNNLGAAMRSLGRLSEAIRFYRRALEIQPNWSDSLSSLGNTLLEQGDVAAGIAALRQAVAFNPKDHLAGSDLLYGLHFDPTVDAATLLREHRAWSARHAEPLRSQIPRHTNDRQPDRVLRVGYVSCDFREHVVGRFFLPLLRRHDRSQFQIYCYFTDRAEDQMTKQIRWFADVWRHVAGVPDEQLAQIVQQDRIDILVDLSAHSAGNRLLLFARKPAPVQVTYLSYPSTTGLATMDYRITDPQLDPPGQDDSVYVEKSLRLPETYWCYEPGLATPPVTPLPASESGYITFGCLNTFRKVSQQSLETWCELLRQIPTARLLLHANEGEHRARTLTRIESNGIDPSHVSFVSYQRLPDYFATYQRIDVALDPFPYAGGTTTCDALWMGVPVVSLVGKTPVARAGLTLLTNVGLKELAVNSPQQYVETASALSRDLDRLSLMRETLRETMRASPLMDSARFTGNFEAALREMWRRWCSEQPAMSALDAGY